MPKIRLRFRLHLPPPPIRRLIACFLVIGVLANIAWPSQLMVPVQPIVRAIPFLNQQDWVQTMPYGYTVTKTPYTFALGSRLYTNDLPLKLGLDIQGGSQVTLAADMSSIPESERAAALNSAQEIIRRRVDLFGVSEPRIQTTTFNDQYQIIVELPGLQQTQAALDLIGQTAQLQFREPTQPAPTNLESLEEYQKYIDSFVPSDLSGKELERATVVYDPTSGQPQVQLQFNSEGTQKFGALTEKFVGQSIGIYLDNTPLSFPQVQEPIYTGVPVITGNFTPETASLLATQLNAGALPVPIQVIAQNTVGPSLGAESLQKSVVAGGVGIALVMLFMVLLYGWSGLLADVGLVAYGLITIALYKIIPITLTLPGVAGLVLSIGMAVDANILTFERIKDEWRAGQPWQQALRRGFGRSWLSIKDANLATLAICFILYNPFGWSFLNTSGPVRGFALTLTLGIFVSLFTGVIFSRLLVQLFLAEPKITTSPSKKKGSA